MTRKLYIVQEECDDEYSVVTKPEDVYETALEATFKVDKSLGTSVTFGTKKAVLWIDTSPESFMEDLLAVFEKHRS